MRIVSGKWKGKRIVAPKNLPTRPTTDFAKEGLFNILNNRFFFDDLRILDLFAGTGNIAYEFASRGAGEITCVDQNKGCVRFIGEMADSLGANIQPVQLDAWLFVQKTTTSYDIVFADPPYDWDKHEALAEALIQKGFLKEGGEAIIEHSADTDLSHLPGFFEHRKYGHVHFSFFSRPEDLGV
ncbi:MAG: RsmD family RNA methyltransferase [Schleiferiaceae bacterium]